jgi:hypothetical protein
MVLHLTDTILCMKLLVLCLLSLRHVRLVVELFTLATYGSTHTIYYCRFHTCSALVSYYNVFVPSKGFCSILLADIGRKRLSIQIYVTYISFKCCFKNAEVFLSGPARKRGASWVMFVSRNEGK